MAKIKMLIELDYDENMMHANEPEAVDWFENDILLGDDGELLLHSNGIGDTVGSISVLKLLSEGDKGLEKMFLTGYLGNG